MKKKRYKPIPKFKNEDEERDFWQTHDATDYFDLSKSRRLEIEFDPGVEAPVKMISLRLPREMLKDLHVLANTKDVPYQSLIKIFLADKILREKRKHSHFHRPGA